MFKLSYSAAAESSCSPKDSISGIRQFLSCFELETNTPAITEHFGDTLFQIVDKQCAFNYAKGCQPYPCEIYDPEAGYAVLKDKYKDDTRFLLIPTRRVTGIEAAELKAKDSPNYWEAATKNLELVAGRSGHALARGDMAVAINPPHGRSQNQLHIHMDCINPAAQEFLSAHEKDFSDEWSEKEYHPFEDVWPEDAGPKYRVRKVEGDLLGEIDPFKTMRTDHDEKDSKKEHSLAVVPTTFASGQTGFYLLDGYTDSKIDSATQILDGCNK